MLGLISPSIYCFLKLIHYICGNPQLVRIYDKSYPQWK